MDSRGTIAALLLVASVPMASAAHVSPVDGSIQ